MVREVSAMCLYTGEQREQMSMVTCMLGKNVSPQNILLVLLVSQLPDCFNHWCIPLSCSINFLKKNLQE